MRPLLFFCAIAALNAALVTAAAAEDDANHGLAFPTASERGPNFPKDISPTQNSPTNWAGTPNKYALSTSAGRYWWRRDPLWSGW